jgi:hypothetical protein
MHGAVEANPSHLVAGQMEQDRVRAALLHLPADQRQVIELRFIEDWSHEAGLRRNREATRALQHRATALRRMWKTNLKKIKSLGCVGLTCVRTYARSR